MIHLEAQQLPLSLEFAGDGIAEFLGVLPARWAARSTLTPCSSEPVVSTAW